MTMLGESESRLLRLPTELQLAIFEYAVIEDEPLLLNCGCDSSYSTMQEWHDDEMLWEDGEKHAPEQPGITRTCKSLRAMTLPIFYQKNRFRAHYCYEANLGMAIMWLERIGHANRLMLRDFCLWDKNPLFDGWIPKDIMRAGRSDIVRKFHGRLEGCQVRAHDYCCHPVVFEDGEKEYYDSVACLFDGFDEFKE